VDAGRHLSELEVVLDLVDVKAEGRPIEYPPSGLSS
jgi:hypothetical protein